MHDYSGRRNGIDVDIEGWVVEWRARTRLVSYKEMDVSLLHIIVGLDLPPLSLFSSLVIDMACREGRKRLLAANLVAVSTGKPRSGKPTVAVLAITHPFFFCIAHLSLSSAGTEVPIDKAQDSSIVLNNVVGWFLEAARRSRHCSLIFARQPRWL